MPDVAEVQGTAVARPLRVLVPLIKDEMEAGDAAGLEHYRRAGELLLEAKGQMPHGDFKGWVERNFSRSYRTAREYMQLVPKLKMASPRQFASMQEALGKSQGYRPANVGDWYRPVKEVVNKVSVDHLARERQNQQRERELLRQLGHQLIDIGYKVLASKLHPDKGGSSEAMARLNKVRNILKGSL
jgi:hypothetical protein